MFFLLSDNIIDKEPIPVETSSTAVTNEKETTASAEQPVDDGHRKKGDEESSQSATVPVNPALEKIQEDVTEETTESAEMIDDRFSLRLIRQTSEDLRNNATTSSPPGINFPLKPESDSKPEENVSKYVIINSKFQIGVFHSLARDMLFACIESLQTASDAILATPAPAKGWSKKLDAHLFVVKHLLILREQTAPYRQNVLRWCEE